MFTNPFKTNPRTLGLLGASLFALVLTLTACKDEENPITVPTGQTITQFVATNNFALLNAALTRAGSTSTLSGTGPFTVFAPSDDAFRAAGFADAAAINQAPIERIQQILQYHVVGASLPASAIAVGQTAQATSLTTATSDNRIYINKTTAGAVSVNGARVVQADGLATNGIVHAIDQVLTPPLGNVLRLAQADTSLSLLVAAASRGGALVTGALSGTTALTVFAPTNAAFRAAGFADTTAIRAAQVTALTGILTNHVIPNARAFSPTLASGATVTTFGGGSLTATVGTGTALSVTSKGNNGTASNVLSNTLVGTTLIQNRDINATNGVIHKIDRVLLP